MSTGSGHFDVWIGYVSKLAKGCVSAHQEPPEANATGADGELVESQLFHDALVDGGTGENDICSLFRQADDAAAIVKRQRPEAVDQGMDIGALEHGPFESIALEALELVGDPAHDGGGASGPDQAAWCGGGAERATDIGDNPFTDERADGVAACL